MRIQKLMSACLFICVVPCMPAQARSDKDFNGCGDASVNLVGKHFHLNNFVYPDQDASDNGGLIVAGVCTPWPTNKSRVIAAFAYNAGVENEKTLVMAVIDTRSNQIVATYKGTIQEDASLTVEVNSLSIDARYDIAPGIRAFGIDVTNFYPHPHACIEGGSDTERTLYVLDHKRLRPVLRLLAISYWHYVQEGNTRCGASEDIAVIIENAHLTLEMGNTVTNGYRDIVVKAKRSRNDGKPTGKGAFSYVLRYDGTQYPTDLMDKAFDKWWIGEP